MFGGVTGAIVTGNNFVDNNTQVRPDPGVANANFTGNYWGGPAPTLPLEYNVSGALASPNPIAGPRI